MRNFFQYVCILLDSWTASVAYEVMFLFFMLELIIFVIEGAWKKNSFNQSESKIQLNLMSRPPWNVYTYSTVVVS